jgi:outer membrane protein assembly factor BamB
MLRAERAIWALAMAACASTTGGATGPSVTTKAPSVTLTADAAHAVAWHNPELHPIDQPLAIAGMAVGLVGEGGQLYVVGVDPATGAKRWQHGVTPSWVMSSEAQILAVGDRVAYLRPTRPESLYPYAELVVADARTGADVWKSPDALFTAWPMLCVDGKAICTITEGWSSSRREHARLDLATGAFTVDNPHIPLRAYRLTPAPVELLDLADYPDNTLAYLRDGRLRWHVRFSALFPKSFRTGNGATWHRYRDREVVVGSISGATRRTREITDLDLAADSATVGLAEPTGKLLWKDAGSRLFGEAGDPPVRVRAHGRVRYEAGHPPAVDGLDAQLEGFDPDTGKTVWAVDVGAAEAVTPIDVMPAIAGPTQRAFVRAGGATVVDYASGASAPAAQGQTFWCRARARYGFPVLYWRGVRWGADTRAGGLLAYACDEHGEPASAIPAPVATAAIGAQLGDIAVIATAGGLIGIRRQAPAAPAPAPAPEAAPAATEAAPAATPTE